MTSFPIIQTRISAPAGLTAGGNFHKLRDTSLQYLKETLQVTTTRRTEMMREAIRYTYTRRSSGATAASIRATPTRIVKGGVEVGIMGGSNAFRFITAWGGLGKLLSRTEIYPKNRNSAGRFKRARLKFIGRSGETVVVPKVTHPGFVEKGDIVDQQMQAYLAEVRENILQTVSRATMEWAEGLNEGGTPLNLRRQYRRSPLGGPTVIRY